MTERNEWSRKQVIGFIRKIAKAVGSNAIGSKAVDTRTVRVETKPYQRDGETQVILTAHHKSARWCSAAARLIHRIDREFELHTGFAIDYMPYALDSDFPAQKDCFDALVQALQDITPDAIELLRQDYEHSLARVRARWEENFNNGHDTNRLSVYKAYRNKFILAAPSTAIGRSKVVGVEYNMHQNTFDRLSSVSNTLSKLVPITQDLLADETIMSGHEKLQLLSGEDTPFLRQAKEAFLNEDSRTGRYHEQAAPYPSRDAVACDSRYSRAEDADDISLNVHFDSHDKVQIRVSATPRPEEKNNRRTSLDLLLHLVASRLVISTKQNRSSKDNPFKLKADWHSKKHPPSQQELLKGLNRLFYEIGQLDPVWPDWTYEACDAAYDPDHPALKGLTLSPRHQPVIAKLMAESFDDLKARTDRLIAKHEKTTLKQNAAEALPTAMPDGIVFGDIKTGQLKAWEKAKISAHARVFMVQTTSAPDAKRRKRALVPLYGVMNERPFTPKQIARLTPYSKPNALQFFPADFLGHKDRDRFEAAYRVALSVEGGIDNPILRGDCAVVECETTDADWKVQWTEISETEGFALHAFSVFGNVSSRYRTRTLTGIGISFLTMPRGEIAYMRPSFSSTVETLMPPEELTWLRAAIDQCFPFEPEKSEAMIAQLETEFAKLAKIYPAALTEGPQT